MSSEGLFYVKLGKFVPSSNLINEYVNPIRIISGRLFEWELEITVSTNKKELHHVIEKQNFIRTFSMRRKHTHYNFGNHENEPPVQALKCALEKSDKDEKLRGALFINLYLSTYEKPILGRCEAKFCLSESQIPTKLDFLNDKKENMGTISLTYCLTKIVISPEENLKQLKVGEFGYYKVSEKLDIKLLKEHLNDTSHFVMKSIVGFCNKFKDKIEVIAVSVPKGCFSRSLSSTPYKEGLVLLEGNVVYKKIKD